MGEFRIQLRRERKGFEQLVEQHERMKDFSIPFDRMLSEWARGNALKFAAGAGAEATGAAGKNLSPAEWDPVTEKYFKAKRRAGFDNSLMVRTGSLRAALCSRGGFAEYLSKNSIMFGMPEDEENAVKVRGNRARRPTVFLSQPDKNMIRRNLQQYILLGADYKNVMLSAASRRYALTKDVSNMNINFQETIA
jgi:hypothetical protein